MVSVATNSLLQAGIAAAQAGNRLLARMHLEAAVYQEHDNPEAWLWLAWTADSPTHAISCLEWVLHFDRKNELALAGLVWAQRLQGFTSQTDVLQTEVSQVEVSQSATVESSASAFVEFAFEKISNPFAVDAAVSSTGVCLAEPAVATLTAEADPTLEFDGPDDVDDAAHDFASEADIHQSSPESPSLMADIEDRIESTQELIDHEIHDESHPEIHDDLEDEWFEREWFEDDFLLAEAECLATVGVLPSIEECTSDELIQVVCDESAPEPTDEPIAELIAEPLAVADETESSWDEIVSLIEDLSFEGGTQSVCETEWEFRLPDAPQDVEPIEAIETPPAKLRVLVVDDSVTVRKLIALTLAKYGYEVFEAEDGVAALRDIGLHIPDLVLADINMPKLDGYRLCRLVKSHENTRHIPVILISGLSGEEHLLRGKLVGCDAYITKPVVPEAVLAVVIEQFVACQLRA